MTKECEMNEQKELLRNGYGVRAKVTKVASVPKVKRNGES